MPPKRPPRAPARALDTPETANDSNTALQNGDASTHSRPDSTSSIRRLDTLQINSPTASPSQSRSARPLARPRGVGRRSQQGRAELEKAELERKQAEAASKVQVKPWHKRDNQRGRGSTRGRMRGGYIGENVERAQDNSVVSGPFSAGQVIKDKSRRAQSARSGADGLGGGVPRAGASSSSGTRGAARVKQETTRIGDVEMPDVEPEDGGYISSSADEEAAATRIDIDRMSLEDATVDNDAPVRVQRYQHLSRPAGTNADGTIPGVPSYTSERKRVKRTPNSSSQRYKGTYTDSSSDGEVEVKQEHPSQDRPTSPDAKRKGKANIRSDSFGDAPAFQTKEEETEWTIQQRDLRLLQSELGQVAPLTADGEDNNPRADKMYLFQFPAILPTLAPVNPKQEDGDVSMQDIPEVGATEDTAASRPAAAVSQASSGLVGKLRVHKSGRAYLDWGGIPMEVSMGQEASFLQDILVIDPPETKAAAQTEDSEQAGGTAMSMGQVKGRFVVVPQWDAIFDKAY